MLAPIIIRISAIPSKATPNRPAIPIRFWRPAIWAAIGFWVEGSAGGFGACFVSDMNFRPAGTRIPSAMMRTTRPRTAPAWMYMSPGPVRANELVVCVVTYP